MVTIKQIAQRAGVSTATVSNVIHGKTKRVSPANVEKIQRLIDEMGYVQRMGFRVIQNGRSRLVAVIINYHKEFEETVLSDPFYGRAVGCIEHRLRELGYYMMFYSAEDMDDIFKVAMTWDVDGIIALTFSRADGEKLRSRIQRPVVSIDAHGERPEHSRVTNIGLDDAQGGRLMVEHLLKKGYDQIFVCAPMDYGNDRVRWLGANEAWMQHPELTEGKKLRQVIMGVSQEEREACYRGIARQLRPGRKTALFFVSDYLAIEASSYLAGIGIRAPDDIGIAGYDDISFAGKFAVPRLTTIRQDIRGKAERAVDEIVAMIDDPEYPAREVTLPVSLVSRQSV